MKCTKYQLFWDGKIPEKDFEIHKEKCVECREAYVLDSLIEGEAKKLPAPEFSPWLWNRIENELKREKEKSRSIGFTDMFSFLFSPKQHLIYKIAALLVVSVGISYLLFFQPMGTGPASTNFLTSSALYRVEEKEKEYEQAIAELEKVTQSLVANADTDLLLLYRDKLETIDAQIDRCKEALKNNTADAHIRRYLLAAYQDKKETLIELIEITQG